MKDIDRSTTYELKSLTIKQREKLQEWSEVRNIKPETNRKEIKNSWTKRLYYHPLLLFKM